MIATIWNIVGSLLLASSTAVFHAAQTDGAFLVPFHRMIEFNILFAALILVAAILIRIRIKKAGCHHERREKLK